MGDLHVAPLGLQHQEKESICYNNNAPCIGMVLGCLPNILIGVVFAIVLGTIWQIIWYPNMAPIYLASG